MNTSQPQLQNLPERDVELLSAYLDNQLSVAERVSLERRLGAEPRLRAELDELRATTSMLRDLDPVRPPRSFTIDPATAPRQARVFPVAWAMQLGSGLAGLALVLLATVQILVGGSASTGFSQAAGGLGAPATAPMSSASREAPAEAAMESAPTVAAASADQAAAPDGGGAANEAGAAPKEPGDEVTTMADAGQAEGANAPPPALPYGGTGGGMGGAPEIDRTIEAMEHSGSAAAEPNDVQVAAAPADEADPGVPPGLTLGVGVALLALATGTYLYRRRA